MTDIICGDQSTNTGTEQTEKTRYERNKDVNGTLWIVESSALSKSLVSAYTLFGPIVEKASPVVATPATRTSPTPRRGKLLGCAMRTRR